MKKNNKKYYIYQMRVGVLNIISIFLLIIPTIITLYTLKSFIFDGLELTIGCLFLIPYFIFHEVLHSISYKLNGASWDNIYYGANLEKGVLCCLCKQNISKKNILISLITPFMIIGVITLIIGILINNIVLITLSIFNISGCSGDLIMFFGLLGLKDFEYAEFDDPTSFAIYSDIDYSNKKMFGLKYVETKDSITQTKTKKVTVTKFSLIAFILIYVLFIADLILYLI